MRFVFINPPRAISRYNIWSVVNSVSPPLGLALLAAVLEQDGHVAEVIDASALKLGTRDILERIPPETDIVGLTATTPEIAGATAIAVAVRRLIPKAAILMGGVHPTIFHEELVGSGVCDMVIRGEAEEAIRNLAGGRPLKSVPSLTWRDEGGHVVVNQETAPYAELDILPFPAYHKLPMDRYRSALGAAKRSPSIGMVTSRGCPGKCTFCYSGMFGARIRFMTPERIIEQLEYLRSHYGIREASFYDDTFTAHRKRIIDLCTLMIDRKLKLSWSCFARVDSVNLELLQLMKRAGCHQICYGFESCDEDILKAVNKRADTAQALTAAQWTREAGIDIRGAFMLGMPGETEESMRKTIDYAKGLNIQFVMFNITTPFPGTELFEQAGREGMLRHTDWSLYDLAHPILQLPGVSAETVQTYYSQAYRKFYFRPSYVIRRLLAVRTWHELITYSRAAMGILFGILRRSPNSDANT